VFTKGGPLPAVEYCPSLRVYRRITPELISQPHPQGRLSDLIGPEFDHSDRAGHVFKPFAVPNNPCRPAELKRSATIEIHKEQPSFRIRLDIPQRVEHVVARVVRDPECPIVRDFYKPGIASAMRRISSVFRMQACNELCVGTLDQFSLTINQCAISFDNRRRELSPRFALYRPRLDVLWTVRINFARPQDYVAIGKN